MIKIIYIGFGGAIGAISRYMISGWVHSKYEGMLPLGTLIVNMLGTFILGFFMVVFTEKSIFTPATRSMIGIGILGAFTTFSTFSVETMNLIELSLWKTAFINVTVSVFAGLFFAWLGSSIARLL
jgi:fluoride exporter